MHIPVYDEDALQIIFLLRVTRADGYIIEETETHCAIRRGMMAGRAHYDKSILRLSFCYRIDRSQNAPCGKARYLKRFAADNSIRIERAEILLTGSENSLVVRLEMTAQNIFGR